MEPAPNKDATDLGQEEDKMGDDVYVRAGNDAENTNLQSPGTQIIPQEINILELPTP